jgi:DNA-binding LytR/AlgR family response regulator
LSRQRTSELARLRAAIVAPAGERGRYLSRIPVRTSGALRLVPTSQVAMIVAHGERLTVTTIDQATYSFECRLKILEIHLDPSQFVRVRRGLMVNLNLVSRIVTASSGTYKVLLQDGQGLGMSRMQAARLRHVLVDVLR